MHFKLCLTAIFETVDLRTGYINLLKALKEEKLTQYLKMGVEGENIWPTLYKVRGARRGAAAGAAVRFYTTLSATFEMSVDYYGNKNEVNSF